MSSSDLIRWGGMAAMGGRLRVLFGLLKSNKLYALVGKRTFREELSSRQLGE
jgi:hypothetical protein